MKDHAVPTYVAAGELRAQHLELFETVEPADFLLSVPGLLPLQAPSYSSVAREPERPLSATTSHEQREALLAHFARELDQLQQTEEWERRITSWIERIRRSRAKFFFLGDRPLFTRLVSRERETLLIPGPLTVRGFADETGHELRVVLTDERHAQARAWFQQHLARSMDITETVRDLLAASWAGGFVSAKDLYFRVLMEFFRESLEGGTEDANPMLSAMTEFQVAAYNQARGILRRFGGVFLSDVVGLGKTYIAVALARFLQDDYGRRAVVVAPPLVCPAWDQLAEDFGVDLVTVSHGRLDELSRYRNRDVLILDESHNFRNAATQRYEQIWEWLRPNGAPSTRNVILLSATPQNNRPRDLLQQLKLFPDNFVRLPYAAESLEDFFREVEGSRASLVDVLQHVLVRRTRRSIEAQYPDAKLPVRNPDGSYHWIPVQFPRRVSGVDQCLRYRIEDTYGEGLYDQIIETLGNLHYALYGIGAFALDAHAKDPRLVDLRRAGRSLRGIFKVLLLKRLESSVHAFRVSLSRLRDRVTRALRLLDAGRVLIKLDPEDDDEQDVTMPVGMFNEQALRKALTEDAARLNLLWAAVEARSQLDAKTTALRNYFASRSPRAHRAIVFTQFADTAEYLFKVLGQELGRTALVTGSTSTARKIAERFAPVANKAAIPADEQLDLLIATDAMSEGVNLQDADTLINFDLHWNPVRLIQRAGRIDRIGSPHDEIHIASFLPERQLEQNLGLEQVLRLRIAEFRRVFGEDSSVLPPDDQIVDDDAASAYSGVALDHAGELDEVDSLSRHADRVFELRRTDPAAFQRIAALRLGRRAATKSTNHAVVATRAGWYWSFWERKVQGELGKVTDVDGLDLMFRHASSHDVSDGRDKARAATALSVIVQSGRKLILDEAARLRSQRAQPALDAAEEWVRRELEKYLRIAPEGRKRDIDRMLEWLLAGQHKQHIRPRAAAWKREKLTGESLVQQMIVLLRFPLRTDELGDAEVVGAVGGEREIES